MIGLNVSPNVDGIQIAAYCQTPVERLYLYGLLKAVFERQVALKRTGITPSPTKTPLEFELLGPKALMELLSHLRDHSIVFWVRSDNVIPFKHQIGTLYRLNPGVINFSNAFCFADSPGFEQLIQAEQAALNDPDNWVWHDLSESARSQVPT